MPLALRGSSLHPPPSPRLAPFPPASSPCAQLRRGWPFGSCPCTKRDVSEASSRGRSRCQYLPSPPPSAGRSNETAQTPPTCRGYQAAGRYSVRKHGRMRALDWLPRPCLLAHFSIFPFLRFLLLLLPSPPAPPHLTSSFNHLRLITGVCSITLCLTNASGAICGIRARNGRRCLRCVIALTPCRFFPCLWHNTFIFHGDAMLSLPP